MKPAEQHIREADSIQEVHSRVYGMTVAAAPALSGGSIERRWAVERIQTAVRTAEDRIGQLKAAVDGEGVPA